MANESNSKYKSTLISTLFSEKENALEMYNALNGTDYDNPDEFVNQEQAEIITAKEKENQEQRKQIEFKNQELEWYKKILKDNGLSE